MPLFEFEGKRPDIHPDAFVASTATLIGDVTVEAGASVWYGAILRSDFGPIIIRADANVQDGSVLHGGHTEVGRGATVGHLCVIHSALLGEECLIGNGTTVLDGATVGAGSLVAAHSLVAANAVIPDHVLAAGSPAQVRRPITGTPAESWVLNNPKAYVALARRHVLGARLIDESGEPVTG